MGLVQLLSLERGWLQFIAMWHNRDRPNFVFVFGAENDQFVIFGQFRFRPKIAMQLFDIRPKTMLIFGVRRKRKSWSTE
jgi:hypothetical protein